MQLLRLDTAVGECVTRLVLIDDSHELPVVAGYVETYDVGTRSAWIRNLYVAPAYRYKKYGTLLVNECCRIAKDSPCESIGASVLDRDLLDKFWRKLGFVFAFESVGKDESFVHKTLA